MAAIKSRRPETAKTYQIVEVPDLTGGQDVRRSQTLLEPDRGQEMKNVSIGTPGEWSVRLGYVQYSTGTLGAGRPQGGQRVYLSSHTFTLVAWNQGVYLGDSTLTSTSTPVLSSLSTNQVYFPYDRDLVVALDGSSNGQKKSTNGSSWTRFGIEAPSTRITASTLSSGSCSSGEYEFAVSFKDRDLGYESNISSGSTITLTASTGAFHLVAGSSLTNDPQVDAYVWYGRDKTAGETVFRKISSGTDSTIRVTDTSWTLTGEEAPTNHDVPPIAQFGTPWKNRWWLKSGTVGNRLHFSELFLPQAFPATFYIDIPFERGDSITAIVPLGDVLVVFGQSKAYLVIGQTSLDFEVRPSAGAVYGCLGARAWGVVEQGIIRASAEGIALFNGAEDRYLSLDIEPAWRDYVGNGTTADLSRTPIVYEFKNKELRVAVTRVYPRATNGEWILNLDRSRQGKPAWTNTDRNVGGYIHFDGNESLAGARGELLTWESSAGRLFKESTGTTANSSNMVAEYTGPGLAMGMHVARVIDGHLEYEPNAGSFATETVVDGVSMGSVGHNIGSGLAHYDEAVYDTDVYAGVGRRKLHWNLPLAAEGRVIVHKQVYTGQAAFKMFTYAYGIRPEVRMRDFTE